VGIHTATVFLVEAIGTAFGPDGLSLPVPGGKFPGGQADKKWIVPERYSSIATSGLSFQVEHGMEPLLIELTSK
jgi:hypothetical protein